MAWRWALVVLVWIGSAQARAQPSPVGSFDVIESGREGEIQDLFAPYSLGQEVADRFRLMGIQIEPTEIRVKLERGESKAQAVLTHHSNEGELRTSSFSVRLEGAPESRPALIALVDALASHDDGDFWRVEASSGASGEVVTIGSWWTDGLLWFVALVALTLWLALRQTPRRLVAVLLGVGVIALWLRWQLSAEMLLGAWPLSRTTTLQRMLWYGPGLAWLSETLGHTYREVDVMRGTGLAFAALTPFAVFAHARALLDSDRRGVIAAAVISVLPLHIRFSHSEVAFIPSIVLSSVLFALVHRILRTRSATWVGAQLVVIALVTRAVLLTRPLNLVFVVVVLLLIALLHRHRRNAPWVVAVVLGVGVVTFVDHMAPRYGSNIGEAVDLKLLGDAARLLFDAELNTLINPHTMPPFIPLLVLLGAWHHRRSHPRLVLFLGSWLGLFFVTHAYVIPSNVAMQARYHLHLVVPLVLLAALGVDALTRRHRALGWIVWAGLVIAPWSHRAFITDVSEIDLQELAFVERVSHSIDDGATVWEANGADELRFLRFARIIRRGRHEHRFISRALDESRAPRVGDYWYEGFGCIAPRESRERCTALAGARRLETVASHFATGPIYDDNLRGSLGSQRGHLRLKRVND